MRLYQLDEVDGSFELLPLAARRALDHAGRKLALSDWTSQTLAFRQRLTELGSDAMVDVGAVLQLLADSQATTGAMQRRGDPDSASVPDDVQRAFGPARPIPDATWSALSALDRYVLAKVAVKARLDRLDRAYAEIVGQSAISNHLEPQGGVRMVNVGDKPITRRVAVAESWVTLSEEAMARLVAGDGPKGDVLGVARVAAIQAAKKTPDLIPLCHAIALTKVSVQFEVDPGAHALRIEVTTHANDRTGVEMEALTAASVAALTVYDMLKGIDRSMVIGPTQLKQKQGGRTSDYARPPRGAEP